jgi:signal transduction histidine kinase
VLFRSLGVQYDITEQKRVEEALREVREAERHRLARDLHDGVLQDLSYTTAAIGIIMLEAEGTGWEEELQRAVDAVRRAAQGLRDAVNDLRLGEDQDQPFPELVESLVTKNRAMARASRIELEVEEGFPATPMGDAGTEVLRVIQEALTNARRHSGAQNVLLTLRVDDDELMAVISDDGRGFNPRVGEDGIGLWSMQERAAALDGTLDIESEPGEGTRVRFRAPMSSLLRETPEVDTKRGNGGDGWE